MNCSEFKQMMDLYIDGELNDSQIADLKTHAAQCRSCRDELIAAEQLRGILSHMNDDISVPLPAQAAWRNAVRTEARRKRMKMIYSFCGAAAAVCVLTVGTVTMFNAKDPLSVASIPTRVESDGVSTETSADQNLAIANTMARGMDYVPCTIRTEDKAEAYKYLCDVIAEYGGVVEYETNGDDRKVFVQIPGEGILDFISAVDSIGTADAGNETVAAEESAASVGVCVTITAHE